MSGGFPLSPAQLRETLCSYSIYISSFKIPNQALIWRTAFNLKIEFAICYLMMTIFMKSRMNTTVNYETWLSVKIRSMQDSEFGNIWVGSEIIWWKPWIKTKKSNLVLSIVVESPDQHDFKFISIAKTISKKIAALICSMKFLSPEVALYLYKSTIRLCMEYCCHVWTGAPSCYLELLDKLQKWIYKTPSVAASLESLAHCWNVASLNLFYRYYFGRCSSGLAELVPLLYSQGRSIHFHINSTSVITPVKRN